MRLWLKKASASSLPTHGTCATSAPAPPNQSDSRTLSGKAGVCPPWANQAMPSTTVRPAAVMVMAMPSTTWSPSWLTQA